MRINFLTGPLMALGLLAAKPATGHGQQQPAGTIDTTLSFSDALENLDFAFMGVVEASKARWTLLGDFAQTN